MGNSWQWLCYGRPAPGGLGDTLHRAQPRCRSTAREHGALLLLTAGTGCYLPLIYLYRKRLPLKNRLLLDTVRTWLDFSNLQGSGL